MRSILAPSSAAATKSHLSRLRPIVDRSTPREQYSALSEDRIREEMAQVRAEVAEKAASTPPSRTS